MSQRPSSRPSSRPTDDASQRPSSSTSHRPSASSVPKSHRPSASARPSAAPKDDLVSKYPSTVPEDDEEDIPPPAEDPPRYQSKIESQKGSSYPKSNTVKETSKAPLALSYLKSSKCKESSEAPSGSFIAPSSKPPPSYRSKVPSSAQTMLNRDQSVVPSAAQTTLNRDKSVVPSNLGTMLNRDGTVKPSENAGSYSHRPSSRNAGTASIKPKTNIGGQYSYRPSEKGGDSTSIAPSPDTFPTRSILNTQHDVDMASRLSTYRSLRPEEKKEQDEWVEEKMKELKACPEDNEWIRVEGGYMCKQGGHGITDEMLQEGEGAICGMKKRRDWENKQGPYYPTDAGKFLYRKSREGKFPGVQVPEEYREE